MHGFVICGLRICAEYSRNSRSHVFYNNTALENFAKCIEKHLCWGLYLIKKRLDNSVFLEILRILLLKPKFSKVTIDVKNLNSYSKTQIL